MAVCQNGETKYFKTPPGNDGKSGAAVHGSVAALAKYEQILCACKNLTQKSIF